MSKMLNILSYLFNIDLTDPSAFEDTEETLADAGEYVLKISGKVNAKTSTDDEGTEKTRWVVPLQVLDPETQEDLDCRTLFYNINLPSDPEAQARAAKLAGEDHDPELASKAKVKLRMAKEFFEAFDISSPLRSLEESDNWKGLTARATVKQRRWTTLDGEERIENDVKSWLGNRS